MNNESEKPTKTVGKFSKVFGYAAAVVLMLCFMAVCVSLTAKFIFWLFPAASISVSAF